MNAEFVAVSQHLDIWQISTKAKKVLLNAINIDSKQMAEPNQSQHVQLRNVVYVGRLATIQKRPQIMLEIAKTIQNKVIIIGEGEAKEEIELRVLKESLNVEMLGYIENPWELFDQSDLLIVPSLFEGDGMVVIEALERDLPILLSDIPDFRRFNLSSSKFVGMNDQDKINITDLYKELDEKLYIITSFNNQTNAQFIKLDKEFDKLYKIVQYGLSTFTGGNISGSMMGIAHYHNITDKLYYL
jgi:glycosyltransferase involved in cell wall biosynthesis